MISKSIIELAKSYALSVLVTVRVIDLQGEDVVLFSKCNNLCNICQYALSKDHKKCTDTHLYGCYQAKKFGGKYVFFCHMGLTLWVSPIMENQQLLGAIVAGPVLMREPDDFILEDYLSGHNMPGNYLDYVKTVPVLSTDRVDSLSNLLFHSLKNDNLLDNSDRQYQQDKISEHIHDLKMVTSVENQYPFEKEQKLLTLIKLGDKHGSQKILNEIFGHIFFHSGKNYDVIKARVLELIVVLSRAAIEGGADSDLIFGMNFTYINEINDIDTVEKLTYWLSKVMAKFTEQVFDLQDVKHVDAIYKSIEYIKRNYMKKVTLDEVAMNSSLSTTYFSRVFKEEMNCSFNNYLNRVRIEMSKKLLLDDTISLVDVSIIVGFEDQSYYSKVFKKITSISPGKFREKRGMYTT
ncbi:MAG: PocR ligand-binding domain-containing protein [Clostridiales bacterium]|nr:PocR ligand-binding domain-containing protein [Clostridiales bacterium]